MILTTSSHLLMISSQTSNQLTLQNPHWFNRLRFVFCGSVRYTSPTYILSLLISVWTINNSYFQDFMDFKPISTRKLRRRLNPDGNVVTTTCPQEKKRKQSPTINHLLDDALINEDLKLINKVSGKPLHTRKPPQQSSSNEEQCSYDARIEEGKLYFEKRWWVL